MAGWLDGDNPVLPHFEGQFLYQSIDKRRPVLVQERDESDGALLGVTVREGPGARPDELAAQRLIAALRSLDRS